MNNLVIVGCSKRKLETAIPMPALDLYQGGFVPFVRESIRHRPDLRPSIFFLSAKHGLLNSDDQIVSYDQELTLKRAKSLRDPVGKQLREIVESRRMSEILLIAEPLYLILIADLLTFPRRPKIYWEPDITSGPEYVASILRKWGWNEQA